jgi:hypothetical protein
MLIKDQARLSVLFFNRELGLEENPLCCESILYRGRETLHFAKEIRRLLLSFILDKLDVVEMTYEGALDSADIWKRLRGRLVRVTIISELSWARETTLCFEIG